MFSTHSASAERALAAEISSFMAAGCLQSWSAPEKERQPEEGNTFSERLPMPISAAFCANQSCWDFGDQRSALRRNALSGVSLDKSLLSQLLGGFLA